MKSRRHRLIAKYHREMFFHKVRLMEEQFGTGEFKQFGKAFSQEARNLRNSFIQFGTVASTIINRDIFNTKNLRGKKLVRNLYNLKINK